jgi:hypothetical protein
MNASSEVSGVVGVGVSPVRSRAEEADEGQDAQADEPRDAVPVKQQGGDDDEQDQPADRRAPEAAVGQRAGDDRDPQQRLHDQRGTSHVTAMQRHQQDDDDEQHRRVDEDVGPDRPEHEHVDRARDPAHDQRAEQDRVQPTGDDLELLVGQDRRDQEPRERADMTPHGAGVTVGAAPWRRPSIDFRLYLTRSPNRRRADPIGGSRRRRAGGALGSSVHGVLVGPVSGAARTRCRSPGCPSSSRS